MVAEILTIDAGEHPANKVAFDRSGEVLAVASDSAAVLCFSSSSGEPLAQLHGHDDAVQASFSIPYHLFNSFFDMFSISACFTLAALN